MQLHPGTLSLISTEDTNTYKELLLNYGGTELKFDSGDIILDFYDFVKLCSTGEAIKLGIDSISSTFSLTDWVANNTQYKIQYFAENSNKTGLVCFDQSSIMGLSQEKANEIIQCVLLQGMTSFEDLKKYYKEHKK